MIKIDRNTAQRNIEDIVGSMNFTKKNYVFLKNKFITQEILVYDKYRIVTFFVKVNKNNNKLKKYCHRKCRYVGSSNLFYELIVSRIKMNEYYVTNIEHINYSDKNNKLLFEDDAGYHRFEISDTNIYGFDQNEQINRLKGFVNQIQERIDKMYRDDN